MKNSTVNKITSVVAKIFEIAHWVGVGVLILTLILSFTSKTTITKMTDAALNEYTFENGNIHGGLTMEQQARVYDFELNILDENGEPSFGAMRIVIIVGIIELALYAMVFRNTHLIAKNTLKPDTSYFCPDNIRMLREIGIFAIASPVVSLLASIIAAIILKGGESVVSLGGLLIGLLVLFLTQFFTRGAELEKEVEGLV